MLNLDNIMSAIRNVYVVILYKDQVLKQLAQLKKQISTFTI